MYNASPFTSRTRCADPRWGRNIESAGEDPFLSGQYAANFIQGFEHANEVSYPLQASACCKHFVAVRRRRARPLRRALALLASTRPLLPLPRPPPPLQNELEATNGSTRHNIDVFVPQQDLVDSYLPSFQTCVEEGKASGIMCSACARVLRRARWRAVNTWPHPARSLSLLCSFLSAAGYNAVNGVPSCANEWLLGTLLRDSWQFDGYVTSDW